LVVEIEHALAFGDRTEFRGADASFHLTLLPAGRIFGSAMAYVAELRPSAGALRLAVLTGWAAEPRCRFRNQFNSNRGIFMKSLR